MPLTYTRSASGTIASTTTRNTMMTALRKIITTTLIASLLSQAAIADTGNLPDLGDESAAVISPLQERKLGEEFMRTARSQLDIIDDPELNTYIQTLGHRLSTKKSPAAGQEFHLFIVNNPSINAFAVPGGYIGIYTGLILATETESELASVVAHESAHIIQRHIPRMIAESQRTTLPAMAALLAAILIAGSGRQGGEAAIAMTTATLAQKQLNFSREFEQEADRIGMGILTSAGYDARGMPAFFERMQSQTRLYETNLPEFLRTHPITTRRIAESRDQAEHYSVVKNPDDADFYHIQAKIRVLTGGRAADTASSFKNSLASGQYPHKNAEHYGYVWSLLANKQYPEARREIRELLTQRPRYGLYLIAQAEIEMAAGNYDAALALYGAAVKKIPRDFALAQRYASALLKTGRPVEARSLLKNLVRQQPDDPALQKMLATAAGDSGALLEAHQAMAEYYYLIGNTDAAIGQLQIARRHAGDRFYFLSSLDARIKEIRDEAAIYKAK